MVNLFIIMKVSMPKLIEKENPIKKIAKLSAFGYSLAAFIGLMHGALSYFGFF